MPDNLLGKLIQDKITEQGISKRAAGRETGTSYTTIDRVLIGEPIDVETLIKLCTWLDVAPSYIMDSFLPGDKTTNEKLAALIDRKPELKPIFDQVVKRILEGTLSDGALDEIVRYAAYRVGAGDG